MSWNIKNQTIEACDIIKKLKLTNEVSKKMFFTMLTDQTIVISMTVQFSLCVRYVGNDIAGGYKVWEQYAQFIPLEAGAGENLGNIFIKGLEKLGLNISNLKGQRQ